jgi:hypothetical protein
MVQILYSRFLDGRHSTVAAVYILLVNVYADHAESPAGVAASDHGAELT